jgi:hypothetical protein
MLKKSNNKKKVKKGRKPKQTKTNKQTTGGFYNSRKNIGNIYGQPPFLCLSVASYSTLETRYAHCPVRAVISLQFITPPAVIVNESWGTMIVDIRILFIF